MERPILFSAPMVRAILAGQKTQTRRLLKPQPPRFEEIRKRSGSDFSIFTDGSAPGLYRVAGPVWAVREVMNCDPVWRCPYGAPGDRLWVRETFALANSEPVYRADLTETDRALEKQLRATAPLHGTPWRPSIHMPRAASRITLEVTGVRVERVQDIDDIGARREGIPRQRMSMSLGAGGESERMQFAELWDSINGKRAPWASNPWVWVIEFRPLDVKLKGGGDER